MNIKERALKIKSDLPVLFLAMKRKETPILAKIIIAVAVAYGLSPIDLIPDFIPVLGLLDDVIIVPALIALAIKLIPPEVIDNCRKESASLWQDGKPKRWYYALPIVLVWLILILIILKIILT